MPVPAGYVLDSPDKHKPKVPSGYVLDKPAAAPSPAVDLESNTVLTADPKTGKQHGEGTYEMHGANGEVKHVPFSKVPKAMELGYKATQKDRERYAADYDEWTLKNRAKVYTREQEYKPVAPGQAPTFEQPGMGERPSDLPEAVEGPTKSAVPEGWSDLEGWISGATAPEKGHVVKTFFKQGAGMLAGIGEFPVDLSGAFIDSVSGDPAVAEKGIEKLEHFLPPQQALDLVGNFKKQWKEDPKEAVSATLGQLAAVVIAHKATQNVVDVARDIPGHARTAAQEALGVTPRLVDEALEKMQQQNADRVKVARERDEENAAAYEQKKIAAQAEQDRQNAIYEGKLRETKEKLKGENQAEIDKATKAIEDAHAHNRRVWQNYNDEVSEIDKGNKAANEKLELLQQKQEQLKQLTEAYYGQEAEFDKAAKNDENAAWKPWHDKVKEAEVNTDDLAASLEKIEQRNPEVRTLLAQLRPDPSEVSPTSMYAVDRQKVMESLGYGKDVSYWDLSEAKRADIDAICKSNGFEPDPMDFNPTKNGKMTLEQVHRAKSIIGFKLAKNEYPGMVKGEMEQVYAALARTEGKGSMEAGAFNELQEGKAATKKYHETFGRKRPARPTLRSEREKVNPERYKEREEERNLAGAQKNYPSLAESYKRIKRLRAEIKALGSEDALKKQIKEVPKPPTAGDTRPAYALKGYDITEPRRLSEGEIERQAFEKHPSQKLESAGEPPKPTDPKEQRYEREQFIKDRDAAFRKSINTLRSRGVWYLAFWPWLRVAISLSRGELGTAAMNAMGASVATLGGVVGLSKFADFLTSEKNRAFFVNPTDAEMDAISRRISPDQQKLLGNSFKLVANVARKQGWKLSPKITAYIASHSGAPVPQKKQESTESNAELERELQEATK